MHVLGVMCFLMGRPPQKRLLNLTALLPYPSMQPSNSSFERDLKYGPCFLSFGRGSASLALIICIASSFASSLFPPDIQHNNTAVPQIPTLSHYQTYTVIADGRKAGMWRPVPVFILLLVLPVVVYAFVSPARVPSSCTLPSSSIITATCLAPSLIHRLATSEDDPPPPPTTLVDKLFSLFFGAKEAKPLGFARISVESSPEVYPATTSIFADPLPGDR